MAFTYTGEGVQERPTFKLAPEGDYNATVFKGEEKISKNGKNMIVLQLQIQHPEYSNIIFSHIVDNEYAQQHIFNIMQSCGITPAKGMAITPQTFVNRSCRVRVKHEEFNGNVQIKVKTWLTPPASSPAPSTVAPVAPATNVNPDDIPF